MSSEIPKLFFETIQEKFAFLVSMYGFKGPCSNFKSDDELYLYKVWFIGKNLSIEFNLDWRDQAIDCYIVRIINGNRADGWSANENGERTRSDLLTWIRSKGIGDRLLTQVTGLSFEEQIPIEIGDYAFMLKNYGHAILEDKPDIFLEVE